MRHNIVDVTSNPELWESGDPVRPELSVEFKTSPGRGVVGLIGTAGEWKAFLCYARTFLVPRDVEELEEFTREDGNVIIPYTVWSYEKGAGRNIINEVLWLTKNTNMGVDRIVTHSPKTEMARKFHLRNKAFQLSMNITTVNFEYSLDIDIEDDWSCTPYGESESESR